MPALGNDQQVVRVGDHQVAVAGHGRESHAIAGEHGVAFAGRYASATAGQFGFAKTGLYGHATAGDYGFAETLAGGTAIAGNRGVVTIDSYGTVRVGHEGIVRVYCSDPVLSIKVMRAGVDIEPNVTYEVTYDQQFLPIE